MDLMKNVFKAYPGKFTVKCTTEDILDAAQFIHQEKMRAKTPQDEFAVSMAYSMAELKKHIVIALGIVIALIIIAVSVNWYEGQNTRNQVNSFISKTQEMGEASLVGGFVTGTGADCDEHRYAAGVRHFCRQHPQPIIQSCSAIHLGIQPVDVALQVGRVGLGHEHVVPALGLADGGVVSAVAGIYVGVGRQRQQLGADAAQFLLQCLGAAGTAGAAREQRVAREQEAPYQVAG